MGTYPLTWILVVLFWFSVNGEKRSGAVRPNVTEDVYVHFDPLLCVIELINALLLFHTCIYRVS